MSIPKKLLSYLDQAKVKYELLEHRTVFTAWDAAQTLHVKPAQIVKTLVVKIRGKVPALLLLPADKMLDKKKIANVIKGHVDKLAKSSDPPAWLSELKGKSYPVEFAKEKWMNEKLLGKIGATPPFGRLLKLPVFMDRSLLKEKNLILNSGDYNTSVKMKAKDFAKLEQPLAGSFSVKK